jgi:hypothetical protein
MKQTKSLISKAEGVPSCNIKLHSKEMERKQNFMKTQGVDFYYSLVETNYIHQTQAGYVPIFE